MLLSFHGDHGWLRKQNFATRVIWISRQVIRCKQSCVLKVYVVNGFITKICMQEALLCAKHVVLSSFVFGKFRFMPLISHFPEFPFCIDQLVWVAMFFLLESKSGRPCC